MAILAGLLTLPFILNAQLSNRLPAPLDSVVQVAADEQGLTRVPYDALPTTGTYWLVDAYGNKVPLPMRPEDSTVPVYQISDNIFLVDGTQGQISISPGQTASDAVTSQAASVVSFISQEQEAAWERMMVKELGLEESQNLDGLTSLTSVAQDTNGLWIEITGAASGAAAMNLHHATNWVYAVWSTTDLLSPWQIETEVWPQDTNCELFSVAMAGRQNLFLKAEDWTDVDSRGVGLPDWWQWYWFGALTAHATDVDDLGNTFALDFALGMDPNVVQFTVEATNNYFARVSAPVSLNIGYGQPSYYAILVDSTNFIHAVWNNYASPNLTVNLGLTEGWHDVWIGLRGHADRVDQAIWQWKRLKLDFTAPAIVLTGPTNDVASVAMIQLTGYSPEALDSISYDLANAAGTVSNQTVLVQDQYYDKTSFEFTTNSFQAYDVLLTNGINVLTVHASDIAGNISTYTKTITFNGVTNAPNVQLTWPQNAMKVCGATFTLSGWTEDPMSGVTVQPNGSEAQFSGRVGRDGKFYVDNIPLSGGTNLFSVVVTNIAGTTTTNLTVVQGDMGLVIDPITPNQTTVTGKINTMDCKVWVNGIIATLGSSPDGNGAYTWEADDVPIPPNGSLVQVTAIPNSDNNGYGSFGGGQ